MGYMSGIEFGPHVAAIKSARETAVQYKPILNSERLKKQDIKFNKFAALRIMFMDAWCKSTGVSLERVLNSGAYDILTSAYAWAGHIDDLIDDDVRLVKKKVIPKIIGTFTNTLSAVFEQAGSGSKIGKRRAAVLAFDLIKLTGDVKQAKSSWDQSLKRGRTLDDYLQLAEGTNGVSGVFLARLLNGLFGITGDKSVVLEQAFRDAFTASQISHDIDDLHKDLVSDYYPSIVAFLLRKNSVEIENVQKKIGEYLRGSSTTNFFNFSKDAPKTQEEILKIINNYLSKIPEKYLEIKNIPWKFIAFRNYRAMRESSIRSSQ